MTCPSEPEILQHALASSSGADDAVGRHIRNCESCQAQLADIRRVARSLAASASAARAGASACLDELALADVLQGAPDDAVRASRMEHLALCGRCRNELASLQQMLDTPELAGEIQRLERIPVPRSGRRMRLASAGMVAAALVLVVIWPRGEDGARISTHRAPTITGAAPPAAVYPIGEVSDARTLRWVAVPGSDRYRVTLYESTGHVLLETQLSDTALSLPDSVVVVPGLTYLWKVEARTGFERWASSELVEFRLGKRRIP